jgi:enoyl-CoA hydratase/carnithine racemase
MADDVTVDLDEYIATVEIHRPPNNFFDVPLIHALAEAVLGLDEDPACRVVVLCAEGKNFCAGADLGPAPTWSTPRSTSTPRRSASTRRGSRSSPRCRARRWVAGSRRRRLPHRIARHHVPLQLRAPRVPSGFGISAAASPSSANNALELLYTGGQVKGEEAFAIGLADRCVPATSCAARRAFAADIGSRTTRRARDQGDDARRPRGPDTGGDRAEHEAQQAARHGRLRRRCAPPASDARPSSAGSRER